MPSALILINTEINVLEKVLESLKKVKLIEEAYSLYGVYDIITKIDVENMDILKETVSIIRHLPGVRTTLTMTIIDS